jgi:hypothetical protein
VQRRAWQPSWQIVDQFETSLNLRETGLDSQ